MSRHQIDYESLAQEAVQQAMRGLVSKVLHRVAKSGLPGEHHFYISFDTRAPGVGLSPRLMEKYPSEMTIVLQNQFWDLSVAEAGFQVTLSFDRVPERLTIPFSAIKVFFDPSVPFGHQFEGASELATDGQREGASAPPVKRPDGDIRAKANGLGDRAGALPKMGARAPSPLAPAPAGSSGPSHPPQSKLKPAPPKPAPAAAGTQKPTPVLATSQGAPQPAAAADKDPGKVVALDAFRKKS
jgi:hypothetical protein